MLRTGWSIALVGAFQSMRLAYPVLGFPLSPALLTNRKVKVHSSTKNLFVSPSSLRSLQDKSARNTDDDVDTTKEGSRSLLRDAQQLIVIRHGDRWDYENPSVWLNHPYNRKGDPSLSSLGHEQARETGLFLNSLFQDIGIESQDITWMSSPFLRTLQTSTQALNAFTLKDSHVIPILPEPGVFEYDGSVDGSWHVSLPEISERVHYFPRLLNSVTTYSPLYVPSLPESQIKFQNRCQRTLDALHERHSYQPKSVLVVVTHAAVCIGLVAAASQNPMRDIAPAAPCSIYQLLRWDNEPRWYVDPHDAMNTMNGYTQHLSTLGRTEPWHYFGKDDSYSGPLTSRFAPDNVKAKTPR